MVLFNAGWGVHADVVGGGGGAEPQFVTQAWELFTSHPKLALIGGLTGQIQGGPGTGRFGKQRARHVRQIPYVDAAGRPFMFVSWVNMGPFLLKRRCAASPHSPAYHV
jgi:hypothetical protein